MVVGPLKNSLQSALVIMIPACLILFGLSVWTMPPNAAVNKLYPQHIIYNYIDYRLGATWLIQTLNFLVILMGAVAVNFLAINQEVVNKNNYLPAFLYMLFAFSANSNSFIHPALLANLCVLISLYFFMETYRLDHALSALFKAAFFMGLSPFFYTEYLLLFPLCFMMLVILRSFQWRDWGVTLLGFLLPLYLFMGISYLAGKDVWRIFTVFKETVESFQKPSVSEYFYPLLFMIIILVVLTLVSYVSKGFGPKVKTQKTKYILLWLFVLLSINIFIGNDSDFIFIANTIPLSILLADYLAEMKQLKIANTLLFLLLGGIAVIYLHKLSMI